MIRLFFLILFICLSSSVTMPKGYATMYIAEADEIHHVTLDDINFWLNEFKVKSTKIVKAQIRLETGNLTSLICVENKNLVGMKFPSIRPTTAIGSQYGHAKYKTFRDSIEDYSIWQNIFYNADEDYLTFLLKKGYAEDSDYITKLKTLI